MRAEYKTETMDPSGFVVLADFVPHIVQEIRRAVVSTASPRGADPGVKPI